ncbi:MAG: glycosyltransferase family 4 protein [Acidobacteriia bacterium]|nr:glycosyltransferase family 4 protein [Terriglobia bacterium]
MPELTALQAQGHELLLAPLWPRGEVVHKDAARFLSCCQGAPLISPSIIREFAAAATKHADCLLRSARRFTRTTPQAMFKNLIVLAKATWLARVAKDWKADHIHAYWASLPASLALVASELCGIPWSFTAHRFDIVGNDLLLWKAEHAQFVRFISQSGLRLSGLQGTTLEAKTTVLHVGVDVNGRSSQSAAEDMPVVALCAASMVPVKAHKVLIDAIDRLKARGISLELWFAGDGELHDSLWREVRKGDLEDRIKFLDLLSHSALLDLYASGRISIAVLASADLGGGLHEGIPVSLIEAMSFAIPAIGTETGGIPELLGGGAGLIVPAQNPDSMADALHLLSQNADLRQSLGKAGQKRVREAFSATRIATQITELFSGKREHLALAS